MEPFSVWQKVGLTLGAIGGLAWGVLGGGGFYAGVGTAVMMAVVGLVVGTLIGWTGRRR